MASVSNRKVNTEGEHGMDQRIFNLFVEEVDYLLADADSHDSVDLTPVVYVALNNAVHQDSTRHFFDVFVRDVTESDYSRYTLVEAINEGWIVFGTENDICIQEGSSLGEREVVLGGAIEEVSRLIAQLSTDRRLSESAAQRFTELTGVTLVCANKPSGSSVFPMILRDDESCGDGYEKHAEPAFAADVELPEMCIESPNNAAEEVRTTESHIIGFYLRSGGSIEVWQAKEGSRQMQFRYKPSHVGENLNSITINLIPGPFVMDVNVDASGYGEFLLPENFHPNDLFSRTSARIE